MNKLNNLLAVFGVRISNRNLVAVRTGKTILNFEIASAIEEVAEGKDARVQEIAEATNKIIRALEKRGITDTELAPVVRELEIVEDEDETETNETEPDSDTTT